jgi:hypothetical protein
VREAEETVRKAREELHKDGSTDDEIAADALLACILLGQGRAAEAQKKNGRGARFAGEEPGLFHPAICLDRVGPGTGGVG